MEAIKRGFTVLYYFSSEKIRYKLYENVLSRLAKFIWESFKNNASFCNCG